MFIKRIFIGVVILLSLYPKIVFANVTININDKIFNPKNKSININDRNYLPMREILEALDFKVDWVDNEKKAIINKKEGNKEIICELYVNDKKIIKKIISKEENIFWDSTLDFEVINDLIYISTRGISEILDYDVLWDNQSRTIYIKNTYEENTYEDNTNFTQEEKTKIDNIKTRYNNLINIQFSEDVFLEKPSSTSPYKAGVVKTEYLQKAVDAINLIRYIGNISDNIKLSEEYSKITQHGAVLLSANNRMSHNPEKPSDMPEEFYREGYKGTSESNISTSNNIITSVFSYTKDDSPSNIKTVGHRRWILNPTMTKTGFGLGLEKYSLMYSFDREGNAGDYNFISWPSEGVFPIEMIGEKLPWSITVNENYYGVPNINNVKIKIENLTTAEIFEISKNNLKENEIFDINLEGYGINNCIIFRPNIKTYSRNDSFKVTVTGLEKDLTYTVKLFQINN